MDMKIRTGIGYDVHKLKTGAAFWLGGINIKDAPKGAIGHSDADVLIHAICDALLGAASLRDIGYHFSDKQPKYKGIDSKILLKEVNRLLSSKGWKIGNIDSVVCLEQPQLNPHIPEMVKKLSEVLEIDEEDMSIKATTSEHLGFIGRDEGITAMASVLIFRE